MIFIKLEEILHELLDEESNELRQQLQIVTQDKAKIEENFKIFFRKSFQITRKS
jgi:hypothetical protein